MSGKQGEINGWRCDRCDQLTYVVHVDDGVTPFMLACRAEGVEPEDAMCRGLSKSLMYPAPPVPQHVVDAVAWEWFTPDAAEYAALSPGMQQHVDNGGLVLRKLTESGRTALSSLVTA